jgi:hypothetical protein
MKQLIKKYKYYIFAICTTMVPSATIGYAYGRHVGVAHRSDQQNEQRLPDTAEGGSVQSAEERRKKTYLDSLNLTK